MKRLFLIFVMFLSATLLQAQNYLHVNATSFESYHTYYFCSDYDGIAIHAQEGCDDFYFVHGITGYGDNPLIITPANQGEWSYTGCDGFYADYFNVFFSSGIPPTEPWPEDQMLKCQGTIRLYAQTNPQEDYTYLWTTGETTPYIDIQDVGTYGVTVTDACGNTVTDQVTITGEYPIHEPYLPDTIFFCQGSSVTLDAGPGFSEYTWSNGAHTQTISVTQPGTYSVQTVNEYGCEGMASTRVIYVIPPMIDESTPRVTIDTVNRTNHPMVVWDTEDVYTDQVAIYREASTNQWQQVGVADYEAGRFIDGGADASERSWRYKLAAVDICGDEAEKGRSYQTMNAAYLGPGVDGTYWVQWTPYKVADVNNSVSRYELWTADNLTDFNTRIVDEPVSYDSYFGYYYVNLPHGIQDTIFFVKAYVKPQYGGGTVLSNFVENYEILDVNDDFIEGTALRVYPNPSNGAITLEGEGRLKVYNLLGQAVIDRDLDGKLTLMLLSGMYLVRLANGTTNETRKVVVE